MLTDTQMGLLWCGILVLIYLYMRQSPASRSAGAMAGAATASAAAAPAAAAAGQPLSEDEVSLHVASTVHAIRGSHSCCSLLRCLLFLRCMCPPSFALRVTTAAYSRVLPCMNWCADSTGSRGAYGPLRQRRGQRTGAKNCGRGRGCGHNRSTSWQRCQIRRQIGRRCAKACGRVWSGGQWRQWRRWWGRRR